MVIIQRSNNKGDIEFAEEHGVWQAGRFAKELKAGDKLAIQLTGTKEIKLMGVITEAVHEAPPYAWPSGEHKYSKTVKFEPINLAGQWPCKRI